MPVDLPVGADDNLESPLAEHFGEAPFFAILKKELRTGSVFLVTTVQNVFIDNDHQKGIKVAKMLSKLDIDEVRSRAFLDGKGAGYASRPWGWKSKPRKHPPYANF